MNAFEELKTWCEKHLDPDDYRIVPESETFFTNIYLDIENDDLKCFSFDSYGQYVGMGTCDIEDMWKHIKDLENGAE